MALIIGVAFAIVWTLGMVWWSGDYSVVNLAILAVCGVLVAAAWIWAIRRSSVAWN